MNSDLTHDARFPKQFYLFWLTASISQLGDVGFMIALPWLIISTTGSSIALASVLAALTLPRALLILIGGVFGDRYRPKIILTFAYLAQSLIVGIVALLLVNKELNIIILHVMAFLFGVVDAFVSPSLNSLVPQLVTKEQLSRANVMLQTSSQIALMLGAALIGFIIQIWGQSSIFIIDAVSYLVLAFALMTIHVHDTFERKQQSVKSSIIEGLKYVWTNNDLWITLLTIALINFSVSGVIQVGLPVLVNSLFSSSAKFGIVMSCIGIGSITGLLFSGNTAFKLSLPNVRTFGSILLGALMIGIGVVQRFSGNLIYPLCAFVFAIGFVAAYINIHVITWLQSTVERPKLSRVMSVLALASAGITPISLAISGVLAGWNLKWLFIAAGFFLLIGAGLSKVYHRNTLVPLGRR